MSQPERAAILTTCAEALAAIGDLDTALLVRELIPLKSVVSVPDPLPGQPCGCDPGLRENGVVVGYKCEAHR